MAALLNTSQGALRIRWEDWRPHVSPRMRRALFSLGPLVLALLSAQPRCVAAQPFLPEERVTTAPLNYEMSRNPNHSLAVDSAGGVHLVFWDGSLDTSPEHPSHVWYCYRDPLGRWSPPQIVDDSYTSEGVRLGGRHPSLALLNDEIRIFWHDYRHCSGGQHWIDNIEIYMDRAAVGGAFSASDIRLTSTVAAHNGDNGYAPQVVLLPSGEIFLAWYDYHFDPECADLFLARSETSGDFAPPISLDSSRLTVAAQRNNLHSYTLPDLAVDTSGIVHLVWTRDNQGGYGVFYMRIGPDARPTAPILLTSTGGDFFDPPRITAGPRGDVFVSWTDHSSALGDTDICLARLRPAATDFDAPLKIKNSVSDESQLNLRADRAGLVHVAWADSNGGWPRILYGVFDPETVVMTSEVPISEGGGGALRPSIALDSRGLVYIAWCDYRHGTGQIYFRTTARPSATTRRLWSGYR